MNSRLVILAAAAAFAAAAVSAGAQPSGGGGMVMSKTPETVTLGAQNGSGETGTATLKDTKGGLLVTLAIKGGGKGPQPAHIHLGSCAKLNPKPAYPLKPVVNGKSVTTVKGETIGELNGKYAVNVHKSPSQIKVYVACGDIGAKGGAM